MMRHKSLIVNILVACSFRLRHVATRSYSKSRKEAPSPPVGGHLLVSQAPCSCTRVAAARTALVGVVATAHVSDTTVLSLPGTDGLDFWVKKSDSEIREGKECRI